MSGNHSRQRPQETVDEVDNDGSGDRDAGRGHFILRKNFNGLQAQVFADITPHGGGNIARANVVGGLGDLDRDRDRDLDRDRYTLLLSLSHGENKALRGDQRSFVNTFQPDRGLSAEVKNLFNTAPPFSAVYDSNTGAGSSWEPRVADPRGRSFTLMVDYKFL